MKKLLSVVIPTKNRSQLLKKCLEALVSQTKKPSEIIIINNSSEDNTLQIISKYKKKLPIKISEMRGKNYSALYNLGANLASSKFIAFLDDDCLPQKNWIKNILIAIEKHPNTILQGSVKSYPKKNIYVEIMSQHYQHWIESHKISNNFLSVIDTKNVIFPKKIIKENPFNENLRLGSHDIELGKRLTKKNIKIIYIPNIEIKHKERETLSEFLKQHWRIAKSESFLKKQTKEKSIKILFTKKNLQSLRWFLKKNKKFIFEKKYFKAIQLILIYFLLLLVRIVGFVQNQNHEY